MGQDTDVIWSDRPWIGPSLVARTIGAIAAVAVALVVLSALGIMSLTLLSVPLYALAVGVIGVAWVAAVVGLLVTRASSSYVLRQSSIQIDQGILGKRSLVVSPSAFSELEVDQGILGRVLNYGSLEVRSQGGQQLNLILIRDPRGVAATIREIMTIPTVRIAKDEQTPVMPVA